MTLSGRFHSALYSVIFGGKYETISQYCYRSGDRRFLGRPQSGGGADDDIPQLSLRRWQRIYRRLLSLRFARLSADRRRAGNAAEAAFNIRDAVFRQWR